jgi:hypothetical protein
MQGFPVGHGTMPVKSWCRSAAVQPVRRPQKIWKPGALQCRFLLSCSRKFPPRSALSGVKAGTANAAPIILCLLGKLSPGRRQAVKAGASAPPRSGSALRAWRRSGCLVTGRKYAGSLQLCGRGSARSQRAEEYCRSCRECRELCINQLPRDSPRDDVKQGTASHMQML